ncbi:DUF1990 family protein [Corynebacterium sp. S7]
MIWQIVSMAPSWHRTSMNLARPWLVSTCVSGVACSEARFPSVILRPCTGAFAATDKLMNWAVQRSVFHVAASSSPLTTGAIVEMRIGIGRLSKKFGCRVVEHIHEAGLRSFTYGTLPGHVERGIESFTLSQSADGTITFTITAYSEPSTWWLKALRPLIDLVRIVLLRFRYLPSVDS